jgi:uncharacterized protein YndB with AHSA1/START domain
MSELKVTKDGTHGIRTERELDAPRDLVFRAHTEPELVQQWLGPRQYEMEIDRYEAGDGGRYRYIHRDDAGNTYGFRGVFHGDPSPDSLIQTFEWEGMPGHVSLDTATLEEIAGGRTLVRTNAVFQSEQDRDGMWDSGMADGMSEAYEQLDELLITLKSRH